MMDQTDDRTASEGEEVLDEKHREEMQRLRTEMREKVKSKKTKRQGVLVVHTGDGKGKSTAAFGIALRAAGHGMKVGLVQFTKGKWKTGEQAAIRRFPEIDHVVAGEGFTWETQDRRQDIACARAGWDAFKAMVDGSRGETPEYRVVIADELNIVLRYDYLPIAEVVAFLATRPKDLHIVITGRDAKPELLEIADTVTEMHLVKHAFEAGVRAQKGIEF